MELNELRLRTIAIEHIHGAVSDIEYLTVIEAAEEDNLSYDEAEFIWELIQDASVKVGWSND